MPLCLRKNYPQERHCVELHVRKRHLHCPLFDRWLLSDFDATQRSISSTVSTPSKMLWKWLVVQQELTNAPATLNRVESQVLRSLREFRA